MWFPRLASDARLRRRPCDAPFALSLWSGNRDHLHCLNGQALAAGLSRGMALADARALCPGLVSEPANLAAEAAVLSALVHMARRWSPLVARDGADGLITDISGVAHLFGGEDGLLADLQARMARSGFVCAVGLAGTRGAAHALARHGGGQYGGGQYGGRVAEPDRILAAIGRLPPAALRLDHDTVTGLERLGLRSIRDLAQVPRAPLARRFGPGLMLRLDQALGAQPEPVSPEVEAPHYGVRLTLPDPIGLQSDVMAGLARLLDRLCATLAGNHHGARRLRLELRRVDGVTALAEIGLARPMRDAGRMAALFARAVDDIDAGYGIDQLRLTAPVVEPMAPQQMDQTRAVGADKLHDLITRLGNRVGFDNVQRFYPAQSHIPEKSFLVLSAAYSEPADDEVQAQPGRPLLIFAPEAIAGASVGAGATPPPRFVWRRMALQTARATGPERIAPEWWLDDPAWRSGLRDYWKLETLQGRRLWLFHTPQAPGWYVQGEFA